MRAVVEAITQRMMSKMKISICIPARSGKSLLEVIESIEASTYQNYEIIISDSSGSGVIARQIEHHDVHLVETDHDAGILKGRYDAHCASSGELELLIDETRVIGKDALEKISQIQTDMATIAEVDVGSTLLARLSLRDKKLINTYYKRLPDSISTAFILPRVFKRELIDAAFFNLKSKLPKSLFNRIIYGDHHLIYYESSKLSNSISMIPEVLIYHNADATLRQLLSKYYRYGKSARLLYGTPYSFISDLNSHIRPKVDDKHDIPLLLLLLLRGAPFLIGYCLSSTATVF